MKKIIRNSIILTILAVFASNCSDKIDLQGPYEENVYVFGMLDASATTQKIKIYKVFGGANGTQSAQNFDSIYFKPEDLDVKLEVYDTNNLRGKRDITLQFANNSTLNSNGAFNPNNAVYYFTNEKIYVDSIYKLVIKTNKNKRIESELIKIADSCNFQTFFPGLPTFDQELVYRNGQSYRALDTTRLYKIKFAGSKNVKGINCKMEFVYENRNSQNIVQSTKSVVYDLNNIQFTNSLNENIFYYINEVEYLKFWGANIPNDNTIFKRTSKGLNFTFSTYDYETEAFIKTQNESNGLSQEKLSYSNIKNGLGFIGSRNQITYYRKTPTNFDFIIGKSKYTRNLKFPTN